jgi:hypothetical protein
LQTKIAEMVVVKERKDHDCMVMKTFERCRAESEILSHEMADLRDSMLAFMDNYPGGVKTYIV